MRFIEHEQCSEPFFQLNQLAQRRAIAVHGKDRLSDDENAPAGMFAPSPFKVALQFAHMIVWKDAQHRAAQSCAIDERSVAEFVEHDDVILVGQCRDCAERCSISATETERGFGLLPFRQRLLEAQMRGQVPTDQPRRAGADAKFVDCGSRCLA